jgi:chromosome partitioning protein
LLELASQNKLYKVVVLNPKGGSGKTTLAFSLAGYLASTGRKVGLLDMDRQGSSTHWLTNRPDSLPKIHALPAPAGVSGTVEIPADVDTVVVDAPAGLAGDQLIDYTCGAHAILVPVLPSDLDIHAASRLISQLLLKAQVSRRNGRLGIVANRVKERTVAYKQLLRFLDRLSINLVGVLRDSQNYTHAAANGRCIHEMAPSQVRRDTEQWQAITEWLEAPAPACARGPGGCRGRWRCGHRDVVPRCNAAGTDRGNAGARIAPGGFPVHACRPDRAGCGGGAPAGARCGGRAR